MASHDFAIETEGLTRFFGNKQAVDSLTLQVPSGSVFAFLGRNGSGKTTTIRMLLGLLRPTRGSSRMLGQDSMALTPGTRGRIGYMSEGHPLHDWMTVAQEGYFASQFHERWNMKLFKAIMDHYDLSPDTKTRNLSRGERAGLSLAITLAPQPDLLVLDDPAIGLDPVARRSLLESVLQVSRNTGRTVFFSSHLLDDVERVADRAAVLDRNTLCIAGTIAELTESVVTYELTFEPGATTFPLPPMRGLRSVKRDGDVLYLTVMQPGDDTRAAIASMRPNWARPLKDSFTRSVGAWLGERDAELQGSIEEAMMSGAGGTT